MLWKANICAVVCLAGLMALGSACSKKTTTTTSAGGSILVLAASGSHVDFSGTWKHCDDHSPNPDDGGAWTVSGAAVTASENNYTSTGGVCNAGESLRWSGTFDGSSGSDQALHGWTDGANLTTAPTELNGAAVLADPPTATLASLTATSNDGGSGAPPVGSVAQLYLFMDDTVANARVYQQDPFPSPTCDPPSGTSLQGSCLHTLDYFAKQ